MYTYANTAEGMPPRLYRRPSEVQADIAEISEKVREAKEMLTVRGLLVNVISEWTAKNPSKWFSDLEESIEDAQEALENLKELSAALEDLREELSDILLHLNL